MTTRGLIILGIAVLVIAGTGTAIAESGNGQPAEPGGLLDSLDIFGGGASMITNDPSTWPYSDSVPQGAVCNAIAFAEGYNVKGSNPNRLNNPGDISDGMHTFGSEYHSGSSVTKFPDAATGWQWLWDKWTNILNGSSDVYSVEMSWDQLAQKWAGNWATWSTNVTTYLGVNRTDRVGDYFGV